MITDEMVTVAWRAYAEAHFQLRDSVPTDLEKRGMRAALESVSDFAGTEWLSTIPDAGNLDDLFALMTTDELRSIAEASPTTGAPELVREMAVEVLEERNATEGKPNE